MSVYISDFQAGNFFFWASEGEHAGKKFESHQSIHYKLQMFMINNTAARKWLTARLMIGFMEFNLF